MLRNVHPQDVSIEPFKTHKRFQFGTADTGSGVYGLRGVSGSYHNFNTGSADSQSFGVYNDLSASLGKSDKFSLGTYYSVPLYYTINNIYYERYSNNPKLPGPTGRKEPYLSYGPTNINKQHRLLHDSCSVISIPQELFGEEIKPGSITVTDNSTDVTFTIKDDGDGNLYDWNYSSSFAAFKSSSWDTSKWTAQGSGSAIGNVFYDTGMLVFTDTGSYKDVAVGTGTDGYEIDYRATHTIYQHEYTVIAPAGQFNKTRNISATHEKSGSITIVSGSKPHYYFPPGDNPSGGANSSASYAAVYNATQFAEPFVTHSQFAPYITTIGLYNDDNELLVIGKTSKPIKNDPEMDMSFVVRFDV